MTTQWFCIPAATVIVLGLLARRRSPFGAPAAFWLLAAAISFVDGRLMPYPAGLYLAGMFAAFLLGNLRDVVLARVGLAIVLGSMATIIFNQPGHSAGELVFIPLLFGIAWLAGFALNARAEQADAAEARAAQAEREREASARIAVAEERARIARELHDIVAHAVSVMVLHVGAVRHKLPAELADESDALRGVEQATGPPSPRCGGFCRRCAARRRPELALARFRQLGHSCRRLGARASPSPSTSRVSGPTPTRDRPVGVPHRPEGLTSALNTGRIARDAPYAPRELWIEVRDDGAGAAANNGPGYGLVGVRERVKIYGGTMTAGAAPEGGFVLDARLPLDGDDR